MRNPLTAFRAWRDRRAKEAVARKRDNDASYLGGWTIRPAIEAHRAEAPFYQVTAPEQVGIMVRLEEIIVEMASDREGKMVRIGWRPAAVAKRAAVRIAARKLRIDTPKEAQP